MHNCYSDSNWLNAITYRENIGPTLGLAKYSFQFLRLRLAY